MRLGLFGGSFDPVHYGHLLLAEQCREQCQLDEVRFIPAGNPPHKNTGDLSSGVARAEMLEFAVAGHPAFKVDRMELNRQATTFTVDTLQQLHDAAPDNELFFLIGADSLRELATWREPERIGRLATIVAVNRGNAPLPDIASLEQQLPVEITSRLRFVSIPGIDLAATDIRRRVQAGNSIRFMTPRAVEAYIADKQLYQDAALERNYTRRVSEVAGTTFLPGGSIEIVNQVRLGKPPAHAVFDFDGTLSLIREGWPDVMIPMMVEILLATGTSETSDQLTRVVEEFVMELTGKQTIYQMIRLAEEIQQRGGTPAEPAVYKDQYHDLLMERIEQRRESLRNAQVSAVDMLVPGALDVLRGLAERGVNLYLASGTDENYVKEEAALLGLGDLFGERIYGAQDDYKSFSKQMVIERILRENAVDGAQLIGFGDGYVEIDNIKQAGGTAIAVASDEKNRSGQPDQWKRDRLIGVGADIVIPDFQHAELLLKYLWREEGH